MAVAEPRTLGDGLFPRERRTPLPGGYMGRLLHVDLSAGRCQDLNLPEEPVLRKLWGGQALGLYLLMHLLPRDAQPLGPENVIGGADCGFAQSSTIRRTHPEVVWAKFGSLVAGAQIASQRFWGS